MRRSYTLFLEDMLTSIDRIMQYVAGLEFDEFESNQLLLDGVVRNIEILGEAANQIPEKIQKHYPDVPWAEMIGMRNIMIHVYFGIDASIIWAVATEDLTTIRPKIEKILDSALQTPR